MKKNHIIIAVFSVIVALIASGGAYYGLCSAGAFNISLADLRKKYERPETKYVTLLGYELHYEDEGHGPVLVLLNGSFGSLMNWDGFVDEMKGHYRIIRLDLPQWGLSGDVSNAVAKAGTSFPDIIKALLDHLHIAHVTMIGNSAGGTEAYRFADKYPQMLDFLIFTQTAGFYNNRPLPEPIATDINISDNVLHHRSHLALWIYMKWLWGNKALLTSQIVDQTYDINRKKPGPNVRKMVPYPNNPKLINAQLAKITTPTFIVFGDKDPVLKLQDMYDLKASMANAPVETAILPGVGHYPPIEAPHALAEATRAYLTRHGNPGLN